MEDLNTKMEDLNEKSQEDLNGHKEKHDSGEKLTCQICLKSFNTLFEKRSHEKEHLSEKHLICTLPPKKRNLVHFIAMY